MPELLAIVHRLSRFEAEPVNTATGNYVSHATDLAMAGRGLRFEFSRTYNSLDTTVGTLGPGWTHSYAAHLQANPDSSVRFYAEDGQQLLFTSNGSGGYVRRAPPTQLCPQPKAEVGISFVVIRSKTTSTRQARSSARPTATATR